MTQGSDIDSKAWLRRFSAQLLVGAVAFVLGLGATAFGLRVVAEQYAPPAGDRLMYVTKDGADCDVVVMGSSVIVVGFRAKEFEERLRKKHGRKLHACAFAMGRLAGPELDFYVRRILASPMPKLKWLLIDVSLSQEPNLLEKNWYTQRELDWQTPRQFAMVASQIMADDAPLLARLQTLRPFARHLSINVLAIGRGLPALEGFDHRNQPLDPQHSPSEDWEEKRRVNKETRAERYRQNSAAHEAAVRKLTARRRQPRRHTNELAATWRDAAAARGVQVAYIVGPVMSNAAFPAEVPGEPDLRIFDFNDPKRYPRLYEISYHFDPVHLTEPGARVFSRAIADELDAAMDEAEQR